MMIPDRWNHLISVLPNPHILQSAEWAEVKTRFEWQPLYKLWDSKRGETTASALVLQRSVSLKGFAARVRVLYVPKGPLLNWNNAELRGKVLDDLQTIAKSQGAIFIKIDPDVLLGTGQPGKQNTTESPLGMTLTHELQERGWQYSREQIQFRNTVLIDLSSDESELLSRMKQKTRYNINLARRKGVTVRMGDESDYRMLYQMYAETAVRDGFVIRPEAYYRTVWTTFARAGYGGPLIAEVEGEPAAGIFVFRFGRRAWYLYGMSNHRSREKMPNYLLQWEAIRQSKELGCEVYDLWGAPDDFSENDPLWGVYRFKEGLGGTVARTIGAWDFPVRPLLYRLYTQTLPRLLQVMRRRGSKKNRQQVSV
jgi:peptidoglycan pentaglycine glycine transferase (the first glycine)